MELRLFLRSSTRPITVKACNRKTEIYWSMPNTAHTFNQKSGDVFKVSWDRVTISNIAIFWRIVFPSHISSERMYCVFLLVYIEIHYHTSETHASAVGPTQSHRLFISKSDVWKARQNQKTRTLFPPTTSLGALCTAHLMFMSMNWCADWCVQVELEIRCLWPALAYASSRYILQMCTFFLPRSQSPRLASINIIIISSSSSSGYW